ncbi:MAG: signal peptide peptidase SppA [Candidatus Krumholzibacteriota bacterium]|nr:signal peptide peptidase SppA [Candidatus Krumholzibacteriota bacterium]
MRTIALSALLLFVFATLAAAEVAIPAYHLENPFLFASPGAFGNGLYGWANPGVLSYAESYEFLFAIADRENALEDIDRLGFFTVLPLRASRLAYSFGFIRSQEPYGNVTDFRYAIGGGTRTVGFGVSYGWSTGDTDVFRRENTTSFGLLLRPSRFLSVGGTATYILSSDLESEGVLDVALRPFGTRRLTIFGDASMQDHERPADARWSVGAVVEPLPGLRLAARWFDSDAVTIGVALGFDGFGIRSQSHIDANGEYAYNSHALRFFGRERNVLRAAARENRTYVVLDLRGPVTYQRYRWFDKSLTLSGILRTIDRAERDERVGGIAMNLSGFAGSRELSWEIRERLRLFRASGKKIVAYVDRAGIDHYHLASIADRILLDPAGSITLEGHMMGRYYLTGTLEKLGIGFDELRFLEYKSAFETLSRREMSDADREQLGRINEERHRIAREDICAARGIDPAAFDRMVDDEWVFLPAEAEKRGLVDTLARRDAFEKAIESLEGEAKRLVDPGYLWTDLPPTDERWGETKRIAVVYALGVCAMDEGISARSLVKDIEEVASDSRVAAVVFRVDSPGGDGLASDIVAEAIRTCARSKPVVVSQGAVAGSGGYWISMYGDSIVAAPSTITGSIGVIGGWLYDKGLYDRLGVTTDRVSIGRHADLGLSGPVNLPVRPLSTEERRIRRKNILDFYEIFVDKVAEGRGRPREEIHEIAQGRVWSGSDGLEIGLVDVIGGLDRAIGIASEMAGIAPEEPVKIVERPVPPLFDLGGLVRRNVGAGSRSGLVEETLLGGGLRDYLRFRIDHNGEIMPLMPIDEMELLAE